MGKRCKTVYDRRDLFIAVLRYIVLGLCAVVAGFLVVRKRRSVSQGQCINRGMCGGCEVFEDCALPPALSAKHVLTRTRDDER